MTRNPNYPKESPQPYAAAWALGFVWGGGLLILGVVAWLVRRWVG